MPKAQKMIFIDRHILFSHIAHAGSGLDHPATQDWWARRAISGFTPLLIKEISDQEQIATHLDAWRATPDGVDENLWSALYMPQIAASVAAVEMAVRRGQPVYMAYWEENTDTHRTVSIWLDMLVDENHRLLSKLPRITWAQAVIHARTWQDKQERQKANRAGIEGTTEILTVGKRKWLRLDTIEAITREGDVMGNCLADGQYDYLPDHPGRREYDGLYSLRDASGYSLVTVMLWNGDTHQALERANRSVRQQYIPLLDALAAHVRTNLEIKRNRRNSGEKESIRASSEQNAA